MTQLRQELGNLPLRLKSLPIDARGYPVPAFVEWIDGKPEFRVMSGAFFKKAVAHKLCWVCGQKLGTYQSFVIGPMCAINRTSSEPPCHHECAIWSAINCPFLSRPHMVRREDEQINSNHLPETSLARNPKCAGVWTTKNYTMFKAEGQSATGWLITMGTPTKVEWFAEGRPAIRAEVVDSIDTGMPALTQMCDREPDAMARLNSHHELRKARQAVELYLPGD
jgi:hypothetical protein